MAGPARRDLGGDRPPEFLTGKYGRPRTVVRHDDGSLLLTTGNTDGPGRSAPW